MIKKIAAMLVLFASTWLAPAQITNWSLPVLTGLETNVVGGTNVVTIGDPLYLAFAKIIFDLNLLTNPPTASAVSLAAGSTPTVTVTNVGPGVVGYIFGIPAGTPNTNTITAYQFTNSVLSSRQMVWLATNNFNFTGSNFLGGFTNYFGSSVSGPEYNSGGPAPPTITPVSLSGSFTGTNGWFTITNGFYSTNYIYLAASVTNTGLGSLTILGMDHFELYHHTNSFYQQVWVVNTPQSGTDPVNKSYVDSAVSTALNSQWQSSSSNGVFHYTFSAIGSQLQDLVYSYNFGPLSSVAVDGTGTNLTFSTATTNLVTGWALLTTTNLLTPFVAATGYTTNISAGVCTFTTPISQPMQFFALSEGPKASINNYVPLVNRAGAYYPSNSFSLYSVTNGQAGEYFWQGFSNHSLVTIYVSNNVVSLVNQIH